MPANYKPFDKAEWLRLEKKADELRRLTIQTAIWGGSGHLGGAMSAMDAMTILYHRFMKIDVNNPNLPDRDRFVLSKGHAAVGYAPVIKLEASIAQQVRSATVFLSLSDLRLQAE